MPASTSPRVGFCVLYGTPSLLGQQYELIDETGKVTPGTFPVLVKSDLLAELYTFHTLRYTTADGMTVSAGLRDGGFGMEDQRNYGDTSFKAMSGLPHTYPNVKKGQTASQTFILQVSQVTESPAAPPSPIRVTLGAPLPGTKLPKLTPPMPAKVKFDAQSFMKVNRDPQQYVIDGLVTLSYCPALHMPDEDTLMENIPTVQDWVRTLRAAVPDAKFRIAPVTINSPYPRPTDDPRNHGLFAAAWCVRMLKYLALGAVEEAGFAVGPGYADQVQQRLGAYAGTPLLDVTVTPDTPLSVDAFAIERNGERVIWVVNFTGSRQEVTLARLSPAVTAELAMLDPSSVAASGAFATTQVPVERGELAVSLDAYSVCEVKLK